MGKKGSNKVLLGRTIIKDRYGKKQRFASLSMLHTSELSDGQDWGRLNLQSITEQTHVDEFLATAELAGTEFLAEKLNIKFVRPALLAGMPSVEETRVTQEAQKANKELLRIPRRPTWNMETTAEQLAEAERNSFLLWRRSLSQLQEVEGIIMTPYERNLEFWRQLWRVIERSDVVVQIVDARDPLLFRCQDLESYVKEIDPNKDNLLLVNKSDYLTQAHRDTWADYFRVKGIKAVFFSAVAEKELDDIQEQEEQTEVSEEESSEEEEDSSGDEDYEDAVKECQQDIENLSSKFEGQHIGHTPSQIKTDSSLSCSAPSQPSIFPCLTSSQTSPTSPTLSKLIPTSCPTPSHLSTSPCHTQPQTTTSCSTQPQITTSCATQSQPTTFCPTQSQPTTQTHPGVSGYETSNKLMSRQELISVLRSVHSGRRVAGAAVTIGLVGYPNVGKSSTINCLIQEKKVSVSVTPGKTKHFQTLFLAEDIILCDCPGLVFPAFVATKQEMIISGILSIDQMKDQVPPINLVASRIPREVFEGMYGITLPPPPEGEDPRRPPTSEELLNTYGFMRGFMSGRGLPDNPRSARYILKDYMTGRLLYCHAPPGYPQDAYHTPSLDKLGKGGTQVTPTPQQLATQPFKVRPEALDKKFFSNTVPQCYVRGINTGPCKGVLSDPGAVKPPRQKNFKKKEKLRRRFAHLDQ